MGLLILLLLVGGGVFLYKRKGAETLSRLSPSQRTGFVGGAVVVLVLLLISLGHNIGGIVSSIQLLGGLLLFIAVFGWPFGIFYLKHKQEKRIKGDRLSPKQDAERMAAFKAQYAQVRDGYRPPVSLRNYYCSHYNTASPRRNANEQQHYNWEHPFFTDMPELRIERSNMPQFRVWYNTVTYLGRTEAEQKSASREWVMVIDGNPRLGTNVEDMPIFIQVPMESDKELPIEDWRFGILGLEREPDRRRRVADLALLTISAEQVSRLKSGPLREEEFDLTHYPGNEPRRVLLSVGVLGGQFLQEIDATTSGGTAEPVGLATIPQLAPPVVRPEETDKL
jgi:hypothetical protein